MRLALTCILSLTIGAPLLMGQGPPQGRARLQSLFFKPDLVMRNQKELSLTPEQRTQIVDQVQELHSEFMALSWDLAAQIEELITMVEANDQDEEALLAKLDQVLDLERRAKRSQFLLGVRIRNTLNDEQLEKLEELRGPRGGGPRRRGGQPDRPQVP